MQTCGIKLVHVKTDRSGVVHESEGVLWCELAVVSLDKEEDEAIVPKVGNPLRPVYFALGLLSVMPNRLIMN